MGAATRITIRNVPPEVARRLKALATARGASVNATVLRIIAEAVGVDERRRRLQERYATWSDEDLREFDQALKAQRTIDEALWR